MANWQIARRWCSVIPMKIHAMFVTRTSKPDTPVLVTAWDEYSIEADPDGFEEAKENLTADAADAAEERLIDRFAVVVLEVNEEAVVAALYPDPVEISAEVVQ